MYDLGAPIEAGNSSPGCSRKPESCGSSGSSWCEAPARCTGELASSGCDCANANNEQECAKVVKEHFLQPGSFVRYRLPHVLNSQRTYFQTKLRTRHADGIILSLFSTDQTEYIHLQVVQGLLTVSYNIGDGDNAVQLPDHKVDTGEWNEISLERMQNEFTLRVNGGGGHREVTEGHGTYKEIKVDPRSIILGSMNKQGYQGCLKDAKLNNYRLPMENQTSAAVFILDKKGVSEGCISEACKSNPCSQQFICTDLWMKHECSCPSGYLLIENTTEPHCMYTVCASHPCKHGTCVPHTALEYSCRCVEGYIGKTCHIPLETFGPGLWFSTIYIISTCFLSLTVLISSVLVWSHCKRKKRLNQGVYHVSAHDQEVEDTRQSIFHYNEEGGGKEDHDAFNMTELQLSLRSSPVHTLCRRTRERRVNGPLSCDYDTSVRQKEPSRLPASKQSCSFTSGDFSEYFYNVFNDTAYIQRALSCDSLKVYHLEGDGSLAGSLSTLASSGLGEDVEYEEEMKQWGPKFGNLCKLYSYTEEDEPQ